MLLILFYWFQICLRQIYNGLRCFEKFIFARNQLLICKSGNINTLFGFSTPPVYKYRIVKSWGRIVNEMAKRYRFNFSCFFLQAEKPAIHASLRYQLTHTLSMLICSFLKYYAFLSSFLVKLRLIEICQRI